MPRMWTLQNDYAVKPVTVQSVKEFTDDVTPDAVNKNENPNPADNQEVDIKKFQQMEQQLIDGDFTNLNDIPAEGAEAVQTKESPKKILKFQADVKKKKPQNFGCFPMMSSNK